MAVATAFAPLPAPGAAVTIATGPTYDDYRAEKRFRGLDGVRGLAMVVVVTWHADVVGRWRWLHGWSAVEVFFVLSGFLIATLCLREEETDGGFTLSAFFVRRSVRILPLYYMVLIVYMMWALVGGLGGLPQLKLSLPYYATYMNEFTNTGPFVHSWSLGVEEKFYLLWPALSFVVLARCAPRWRVGLTAVMAAVALVVGASGLLWWAYGYGAILVGCLMAFAMHDRRWFAHVVRLARPRVAVAALVLLGVVQLLLDSGMVAKIVYPAVFVSIIPALVLGTSPALHLLERPRLAWMGQRSYAFYLVHMLAMSIVVNATPNWIDKGAGGVVLMAATIAVALAIASCLHQFAERPLIGAGRLLSNRLRARHRERVSTSRTAVNDVPDVAVSRVQRRERQADDPGLTEVGQHAVIGGQRRARWPRHPDGTAQCARPDDAATPVSPTRIRSARAIRRTVGSPAR